MYTVLRNPWHIPQYVPRLAARRSSGVHSHHRYNPPLGALGQREMCFIARKGVFFRAMQVPQYLHCSNSLEYKQKWGKYPWHLLHWCWLLGIWNENNDLMLWPWNWQRSTGITSPVILSLFMLASSSTARILSFSFITLTVLFLPFFIN